MGTSFERRMLFTGCVLIGAGLLLNPWFLSNFSPDGNISSTPTRVFIWLIEAAFIAFGLHKIRSRRIPRAATWPRAIGWVLTVASAELFVISVVGFAILETLPSSMYGWLQEYHSYYYAVSNYEFDRELEYRNRPFLVTDNTSQGELFNPRSRVEPDPFSMHVARDANGHNNHQLTDRADVVVLGDSFTFFGRDADDTFGGHLEAASNLTTHTLGVNGYGPPQYLTLFRRYGKLLKPAIALFCFYEGNDIEDTAKYMQFRETGAAWGFQGYVIRVTSGSMVQRYAMALWGTAVMLRGLTRPVSEVAELDLRGRKSLVTLAWKNDGRTPEELLKAREWRELASVLRQFKEEAEASGVVPALVFIPTLEHVYGQYTTSGSDASWNERRALELSSENHQEEAVARLANQVDLRMVSLTPAFKASAANGVLLYYRSDTHWNTSGRSVAANVVAPKLREWMEHRIVAR